MYAGRVYFKKKGNRPDLSPFLYIFITKGRDMKKRIVAILILSLALTVLAACGEAKDTRPVQEEDIGKDIMSIASIAGLTDEEVRDIKASKDANAASDEGDIKTAARNAITRLQAAKTEDERSVIIHEFTEKASAGGTTVVIARSTSDQKSKTYTSESKEANSAKNTEKKSEAPAVPADPVDEAYNYTDVETKESQTQVSEIKGEKAAVPDPYEGRSYVWIVDQEYVPAQIELRYKYGDASNTYRLVSSAKEILISSEDEATFIKEVTGLSGGALLGTTVYMPGEAIVLGTEWVTVKEEVPEEGHWEWIVND